MTIWRSSDPVPRREPPPKAERISVTNPALATLRSALDAIPNDDNNALDYDTWRNVLFAIHHATEGSDEGLTLAHEFSARNAKYDPEFLDNRFWPYAGQTSGNVITERSLFALAEGHGWQDPATADDFEVIEDTPEDKAKAVRFNFVQAAQFSAGQPMGWIIKHVLPRGSLVVLYGESGAGKSFLALDLMASIARGGDWRGHRITTGLQCGYIAAEGAAGFRSRLQAYARHHETPLDQLPLAVLTGAPNFMEKADIIDLGNAMRRYGRLDVLVVDTLAQVTAGANENSGEDMGRVIAHCNTLHQVTGATIVLVHHSGKDASRGARGWSGIKGALDAEIEVTRSDHDRVMTISKMKDGRGEGMQYGFRLLEVPLGMDEDDEVYGSCVIEHCETSPLVRHGAPKGKHEKVVYRVLMELMDNPEVEVTRDSLLEAYLEEVPADANAKRDLRRQHADRALRSLIDRGFVIAEGLKLKLPGESLGENEEE